jgi:hypothetical protein
LRKKRVDQKHEQQGCAKEVQNSSSFSGMFENIVRPELIKGSVPFAHDLYYNGADVTSATHNAARRLRVHK